MRMNERRSISLLLVVIFTISFLCPSHITHAAGGTIRAIEFTGNKRISDESIRSAIKVKVGDDSRSEAVNADIKALYNLGQFHDVRAEVVPMQGGVKLTYVLEEKPVVAEIAFEGNKKLKAKDLETEVSQHVYSVLDENAVAESIEKIKAVYAKKGYYLADIDYHVEKTEQGESKLVFDVKEHQGVAVRKVLFVGNKVFKDKALREVIRTKEKTALAFLTGTGKYDEEQLKTDTMILMYHYLNNGYLKAKVSPAKVTISKDKRYIFVTFQVYEGNQYKIGNIAIGGDVLTTEQEILSLFKSKKGEIYSQKTFDMDLLTIQEKYGDEGYAYASINPQTLPDDDTLTADINVYINKGKRIRVEKINISGNTTTRDKVIRRELFLKERDRYSERLLRKSKENLMRLGFFESVNFATPRGSRDDTMVINVTVKEKPTGAFNISAGFSTFEKFIFSASVQKENFFGYGISGQVSAELSKKRQLFMLQANDPYFLDSKWAAGFSVYRSAFSYTDFRRESLGGDVTLGHRIFDYFFVQMGYQIEDVKVSEFSFAVPQLFRQNASGLTSALSLTLSRDTRDNRITPHKGLFNVFTQEVSGTKLGGQNDFYRINFRNSFYYPVWKTIVFQQFARIGYIKSLNKKPVPLFERFFLGGPNNMRGYNFNTIGPKLRIPASASGGIGDFVYGGDKLLLLMTELELPIYDKAGFRAVAFFDAGNVYAEEQNYSFNNIRLDYGFGLRWNSPMGPLRFEWGFPINRRPGEDGVVFNFTIGNSF